MSVFTGAPGQTPLSGPHRATQGASGSPSLAPQQARSFAEGASKANLSVCYYLSNNKGERYDNPDRSDLQAL